MQLERVEHMLDLFRPFIYDNRWVFRTDTIRELSEALEVMDAAFAWTVPDLDWRHYWVDVEYPGLCTWSIPVLRGEEIPSDPPSVPRFRLVMTSQSQQELAGK